MALVFLMGVMTMSFALPIDLYESLELRKWLVYKDFILKDTKLLVFFTMTVYKTIYNFYQF